MLRRAPRFPTISSMAYRLRMRPPFGNGSALFAERAKSCLSITVRPKASRGSEKRSPLIFFGAEVCPVPPTKSSSVSGSQQALSLASRVLFEPGDPVAIEDPAYQGARKIFEADGLRLIPRAVDEDGLDPADLGAHLRGVYVTPSHQFPTGATMPLARRLKLLAWAEAHGSFVLEDDYDSEYRYQGRPLEAIQSLDAAGRVLYIGTF